MFTIKLTELINAILATASLSGDITARGEILGDNDELALSVLLSPVICETLQINNLPYRKTRKGWRILATDIDKARLLSYLTAVALSFLAPARFKRPTPLSVFGPGPLPYLKPYYF